MVLRIGWMIKQDQGFATNHYVPNNTQPPIEKACLLKIRYLAITWPACGWMECAASPTSATLRVAYARACCNCKGKDTLGDRTSVTIGGRRAGGPAREEALITASASWASSLLTADRGRGRRCESKREWDRL